MQAQVWEVYIIYHGAAFLLTLFFSSSSSSSSLTCLAGGLDNGHVQACSGGVCREGDGGGMADGLLHAHVQNNEEGRMRVRARVGVGVGVVVAGGVGGR
jgi:hypothetical protein